MLACFSGFAIAGKRLEQEIPTILKQIRYPTTVSKSSFQTLGTNHSWPSVLGVIHYIVLAAQINTHTKDHMNDVAFPNVDDNGFQLDGESDHKSIFKHFVHTYDKYQKGQDEFVVSFGLF